MDQMRRCVVTLLDLVGMKDLLADDRNRHQAIHAMEALDRICNGRSQSVTYIDHVYCWNDSALFLSYLDMPPQRSMGALVQEVSEFKSAIDNACRMKSFVVMVKGMTFVPTDLPFRATMHQGSNPYPVYHYMLASSMAFANCETITKKFHDDHHDWYMDQRIRDALGPHLQGRLTERGEFKAFPRMTTRKVFTADGYLHQEGAGA